LGITLNDQPDYIIPTVYQQGDGDSLDSPLLNHCAIDMGNANLVLRKMFVAVPIVDNRLGLAIIGCFMQLGT